MFRGRLKGAKKVAGAGAGAEVGEAGGKGRVPEGFKGEGVAGANDGKECWTIVGCGVVEAVKLVFCSGTWDNKGALAGAVSIEKSLMVSFFRGRF